MEERYLYRAKRIDNGEWVEGFLIQAKWYINEKEIWAILPTDLCLLPHCEISEWIEIDQSTICQCTGLKDKNGNKVYIGDIVKCSRGCQHEVIWLEEYGGSFIGGMPAIYLSGLKNGYAWTGSEEVIGNIFDNPELLEK